MWGHEREEKRSENPQAATRRDNKTLSGQVQLRSRRGDSNPGPPPYHGGEENCRAARQSRSQRAALTGISPVEAALPMPTRIRGGIPPFQAPNRGLEAELPTRPPRGKGSHPHCLLGGLLGRLALALDELARPPRLAPRLRVLRFRSSSARLAAPRLSVLRGHRLHLHHRLRSHSREGRQHARLEGLVVRLDRGSSNLPGRIGEYRDHGGGADGTSTRRPPD